MTCAWDLVYEAVRDGRLKKLDGTVPCVDCGKPAKCYDHRDYSKPLDVEPVCVGCNGRRGPALRRRRPPEEIEIIVDLDPQRVRFLDALAESTGLDRSGVLRLAIRRLAELRGIE